jgi:hypothetical protein
MSQTLDLEFVWDPQPCASLILQSTIKNQNPEDPYLLSPEHP